MGRLDKKPIVWLALGGAVCCAMIGTALSARAGADERVTVRVMVEDAETGKPIYQAHLTLQFEEPQGRVRLKRPKMIAYYGKTDLHGTTKFADVPVGAIRLIVTDPEHQTFGKGFELTTDNQLITVKLKKPQPLL